MIAASILALGLFGLFGGGHGPDAAHPGGWTLHVDRDAFTETTRCTLVKRDASATAGWVTLHLGPKVDTLNADIRIDGGAARKDSEFPRPYVDPNDKSDDPILNPTGGRVVLPQDQLMQAKSVAVRPARTKRIWRFDVSGLAEAAPAAARAGCPGWPGAS